MKPPATNFPMFAIQSVKKAIEIAKDKKIRIGLELIYELLVRRDSNPLPFAPQANALPSELQTTFLICFTETLFGVNCVQNKIAPK